MDGKVRSLENVLGDNKVYEMFFFCSFVQKNFEVVMGLCEIVRVGKFYFES